MKALSLFVLIVLGTNARAECQRALGAARARPFALALLAAAVAFPAHADDGDLDPRTDWKKAPNAEVVAKGTAALVYRFRDEVDGKKVVCYFVDTYYTGSDSGKGGITCVPY